jgi:predicted transposase YbfD/YdcC
MSQITIVEAFADLEDCRRRAGMRHQQSLCLALFPLAVAAGNRGFIAIGDWLKAYHDELLELFKPEKTRLPSYSTIRRTLLRIDRQRYSACLSRFFGIDPIQSETIAVDGKVLRGSYEAINDDADVDSHPAIMLVSAYIVERGLILNPYEVDSKTNEITALPAFIKDMALKGVVFAFDAISTQKKTAQVIVDSGNDYIGALKGNQSGLLEAVQANFKSIQTHESNNVGHGPVEKRTVSISNQLDNIPEVPGIKTVIRVISPREVHRANIIEPSVEIRFYVSSLSETAEEFAKRIRGYWGVENKVHYVRDVTQGEDASRVRTKPLVQIWAIARNFARSHIPRLWIS